MSKKNNVSQFDVVVAKTPSLPITPFGRLCEIGKAAEARDKRMKQFSKEFNLTGIVGKSAISKKKSSTIILRPGVGVISIVTKAVR